MVELSIIMPCYKGEKFIENSIGEVEKVVSEFCNDFEVIVVVDGFVDKTYEIAKKLEEEFGNLKVVGYEKNRGKGYAIKYGLRFCEGDYIALLDSDLDYHPKALKWFLGKIKNDNVDVVIGNRRDKNSVFEYSLLRKFLSYCFNAYVNLMFPELKLRDTQAGIKMFKHDVIEDLFNNNYKSINGYAFDICILVLARRKGYEIGYAPCIFKQKFTGIGSGVGLIKTIYKMGSDVIKLKMRLK
ncbi:glycosyltransferase family 2 protein [Methanotorris formicicus]|uniref:Glycosyl transferase family 2 n=1 Tax=Methanotorris formicicus Mc-S-70 TaxID=647171 RepID=H1KX80_9EURY|nr:glycosyltransferase family 2 protein [Methanotorris formicicus]EHP88511.1 glycosyl transferase family 2 [Methanotorris formicicus Mc-S-70]